VTHAISISTNVKQILSVIPGEQDETNYVSHFISQHSTHTTTFVSTLSFLLLSVIPALPLPKFVAPSNTVFVHIQDSSSVVEECVIPLMVWMHAAMDTIA
jgi:hypothetical protein